MRYIIGIDLGTTNSCVSYVDTTNPQLAIQPFQIPQYVSLGIIESLPTLPSFCYLNAPYEWPEGSFNLPWRKESGFFVGSFAKSAGARVPTRLVQSAKSWLCHSAANRRDKILPLESGNEDQKISPVEATAHYLAHIKDAWNANFAKNDPSLEFEQQEIILTVPASFDEIARKLTTEAAQKAGLINLTLLEEPQAAFYSWISYHEKNWTNMLKPNDTILVCDVGGGTTDFSLINVVQNEDNSAFGFQRMAIGEHLLLGGDNMDAAIAHHLELMIKAKNPIEFNTLQWLQLKSEARTAKEFLLTNDKDFFKVILQGTGSGVVKGSLSVELSKADLQTFLLQGFFGQYSWEDALKLKKTSGMRSMGLPYEDEPSINKHIASFLKTNKIEKSPDFILFNGGTMKPKIFQDAIVNSLISWFPSQKKIEVLESKNLDLAVARGAAYYGKARRGLGIKIGGGSARGYYLEVAKVNIDDRKYALTLLSRGFEEGSSYEPDEFFWILPNQPVTFNLYSSHVRLHDTQGTLIPIELEELQLLPPIRTILKFGKRNANESELEKIPVKLIIKSTTYGTLEINLKSVKTEHIWALEFQMKSAGGHENSLAIVDQKRSDITFDASHLQSSEKIIEEFFMGLIKPEKIMKVLENNLDMERKNWPSSVIRGLWGTVLKQFPNRKFTNEYEVRWWNFAGFLLRPGFGYPLDDFRMKEFWKAYLSESKALKSQELQIQIWICVRRIAGGLNKGQQIQIANEILPLILNKKTKQIEINKKDFYIYSEQIRALAAFEHLDIPTKIMLGNALIEKIKNNALPADYWSLARLGARHLAYGSITNVIPKDTCEKWIQFLINMKNLDKNQTLFILGTLARKTDHREINLSDSILNNILEYFPLEHDRDRLKHLLEGKLSPSDEGDFFGDAVPVGLLLS